MNKTKRCQRCKKRKSTSAFPKNRNVKDGHGCWCSACMAIWRVLYYKANKEKIAAKGRKWRRNNREKWNAIVRAWRNRNISRARATARAWNAQNPEKRKLYRARYFKKYPEKILEFKLKPYGLSVMEYKLRLKRQRGICPGCLLPGRKRSRLYVDHDHKTGMVRGLLCVDCNKTLGFARDDARTLIKLAKYLSRHQKNRRRQAHTKGGALNVI